MPTSNDPLHLEPRLLIVAELLEKTAALEKLAAETKRLAEELRDDNDMEKPIDHARSTDEPC
jgi:hypothetical protein